MSRYTERAPSCVPDAHGTADPGQEPGSAARETDRRRPARRTAFVAAGVAVVVAACGAVLVPHWTQAAGSPSNAATPSVSTTVVRRTDLSDTVSLDGTLGYGSPRAVGSTSTGTVTRLPAVGSTVTRGHELYRVDNRPAMVFYGSTPLYRRLDTVGMVGPDVRVVADNLRALGYDIGAQPPVGTLVTPSPTGAAQPSEDAEATSEGPSPVMSGSPSPATSPAAERVQPGYSVLTHELMAAIGRWQRHTGVPETSVLETGDVVVTEGAVRVAAVKARNGDAASGELMSVTGTGKRVTVTAGENDSSSFRKGNAVEITLPDGSTVPGRISAVGTVISSGSEDSDTGNAGPTRSITVTLDKGRALTAVRGIDAAPVQVRFTGRTSRNVLVVPVGALLALSEGGYAVQLQDGKLIKVTTGLFAKGLVEISGSVTAGARVVTTS